MEDASTLPIPTIGVCSRVKSVVLFLVFAPVIFGAGAFAQVTIAQLSDTHLGENRAPHAADNLRKAVEMINARHPDAVVLSGDIGESREQWERARAILKDLKAHLYYVPGNHDVHSDDVERYREVFGKDYYRFSVKNVDFIVIDSELLGNFDKYESKSPPPLTAHTETESHTMVAWLEQQASQKDQRDSRITIGVQHIPIYHDNGFPDPKPYWIISDPYRAEEMELLRKLRIKDMLVGHWHVGRVFQREGITWHVAPATSWLPWGGELGFAMHTISKTGDVRTDFVPLGTEP
jgi:DNA repair exonuclease SbcCD nuclease subunit